jgi:hypothetical protein
LQSGYLRVGERCRDHLFDRHRLSASAQDLDRRRLARLLSLRCSRHLLAPFLASFLAGGRCSSLRGRTSARLVAHEGSPGGESPVRSANKPRSRPRVKEPNAATPVLAARLRPDDFALRGSPRSAGARSSARWSETPASGVFCEITVANSIQGKHARSARTAGCAGVSASGAAQESNLPSLGLPDLTGFEDRLGHRAHAAPATG